MSTELAGKRVIGSLSRKGANLPRLAARIVSKPESLPQIVEGLRSDVARVRFGCARLLRIISESEPRLLYPMFDIFVGLLDSKNKIFQWDATFILARLATVDSEGKFEPVFDRYFAPIPGPALITAANVIGGAATIASAKPHLAGRITREILKVEKAQYQTAECRNVALGQAMDALDQFFDQIVDKEPILRFVRRQLKNTRSATRERAEEFLKNHGTPPASQQ